MVRATRGARTALYCALTLTTLDHLNTTAAAGGSQEVQRDTDAAEDGEESDTDSEDEDQSFVELLEKMFVDGIDLKVCKKKKKVSKDTPVNSKISTNYTDKETPQSANVKTDGLKIDFKNTTPSNIANKAANTSIKSNRNVSYSPKFVPQFASNVGGRKFFPNNHFDNRGMFPPPRRGFVSHKSINGDSISNMPGVANIRSSIY